MTSKEHQPKRSDESADKKARDAATAEPRKQELTDKELGAVTGGDIFSGQGGGSGRTLRGG